MAEGVDRRRYVRQRAASLTYIELGTDNGGIVLNLGEGGLAFAAAAPLQDSAIPQLRFRLPGSSAWIRASAQIAWIGESRKEAGVSFVHLTETDRKSIREWLSTLEPAMPATTAFNAFERSKTEFPRPPFEFEPESKATPLNPGNAGVETAAAPVLAPPVPAVVPPATQVRSEVSSAVAEEQAKEPWIRVELRLHRWLATAFLVLLAALLSFFAGVLAARHSWADRLRVLLSQTPANVRSGHLESADENPAAQQNTGGSEAPGPDLTPPSSAVPSPAGPPPTSQKENEAATQPPVGTSSAAIQPFASRNAAPPTQPGQATQPTAAQAPPQQAIQQANQPGNQAAGIAAAPIPETPPPASATVPAADPAASAPHVLAPIPTGSVEVNADPYPSIRIPPEQRDSTARMPFRLGQLSTRIEPIYPLQALQEGVQGVVQLHLLIAADGTVMDMQVVRGPQVLIQPARDAVGRWRYQPTYLGDQAVQTETDVTVNFRITAPPQ